MTNPTFPWPMDKPVEEIIESFLDGDFIDDDRIIDYLITRLKLADGERDSYRELYREADNKWNKD